MTTLSRVNRVIRLPLSNHRDSLAHVPSQVRSIRLSIKVTKMILLQKFSVDKLDLSKSSATTSPYLAAILIGILASSTALQAESEPALAQELHGQLEHSRANLQEKLDPASVTPEQRAILIESWLAESASLEQSITRQQRKSSENMEPAHLRETAIPHAPVPPDATPLQRDIIETENEVLTVIQTILNDPARSPEQRASVVESFLDLNRQSLRSLELLKLQEHRTNHPVPPSAPFRIPATSNNGGHEEAKASQFEVLLFQADSLTPEVRAEYIEKHFMQLNNLIKQIPIKNTQYEIPSNK